MHSFVRSVCNLWRRSRKSIFFALGVMLGIFISWGWKYVNQYFNYQDLDLIIKFISGIGVIVAGVFVYIKWQDEKTRQFYERRLQKVYAPLVNTLIKQEAYRKYLKDTGLKGMSREEHPIIKTLNQRITIGAENKVMEIREDVPPVVLKKEDFVNAFTKVNWGLVAPSLLTVASEYEFALPYETKMWDTLRASHPQAIRPDESFKETPAYKIAEEFTKKTKDIERKFIEEIVKGYNECIDRLELDAQKINLEKEDFWEKTT